MLDAHSEAVIIETMVIVIGGGGLAALFVLAALAVAYVVPGQPKR